MKPLFGRDIQEVFPRIRIIGGQAVVEYTASAPLAVFCPRRPALCLRSAVRRNGTVSVSLSTPREIEVTDWGGTMETALSTLRGVSTRDSESSSGVFWGAVGTVTVPPEARTLSFEPENRGLAAGCV